MTNNICPPSRPEFTRAAAETWLREHGVTGTAILGRRGYYRDTMGTPGQNDRGIYDDAIAVITPDVFRTFNANTDPSIYRPGIACLTGGIWQYKIGTHGLTKPIAQQYRALVQAAPVIVDRDGQGKSTGWFGINIHRGSLTTTSSEGCQTIYPAQWAEFIDLVSREMTRLRLATIRYVLTERA